MESAVKGGFTKRFDIPISHLEFDYVKSCSDVKELEKILKVLRTNEEGYFPDLERCCEERLTSLSPNSRVLRRDKPVSTKGDLDLNERAELDNDLKSWTNSIRSVDSELNTPAWSEGDTDLPPIRSGSITLTAQGAKSSTTTKGNKRVMPRDHREWDKIDIDKELEKVDEQDGVVKEKTVVGNREVKNIPEQVNVTGLSEQETLIKANREKDKGNEAFRSGDFKEAISYYSRSISLQPTAASYNNRALAYLKHEDWHKAVGDTNTVLKMEPDNVKALLRRGSAYKGLKQYGQAKADLNGVLTLEPKNKRAQDLIQDIDKIIQKEKEEKKTKGRRMVIEDVDGTDDENDDATTTDADATANGKDALPKSEPLEEKKPSRRMHIEEVESDDEEEEEEKDGDNKDKSSAPPLVNGHISPSEETSTQQNKDKSIDNPVDSKLPKTEQSEQSAEPETNIKPDKCDTQSNVNDIQTEQNSHKETAESQTEPVDCKGELTETKMDNSKDIRKDVKENVDSLNSDSVIDSSDKTDISNTDGDQDVEEDVKSDVRETAVFKRPVFYKMEFPESCVILREEANVCFKNGQYGDGCQKYSKLITILEKIPEQIVNLSLTFSNRAACYLKTGDLPNAVKDCTKSLELVPHSFKPLLRRAMAYEHLERYDRAYVDYRHVLLIDGNVQQAHLGTKRCQEYLSKKDGPRWREKVKLTQVSMWEIPEIKDISEKDILIVEGQPSIPADKPQQAGEKQEQEKQPEPPKEEVLTPQEKFDKIKAKGNEFVKQGKFKEAVNCYSECCEILPDEMVSYTNRALCYIRLNQADKAESDCTRVLEVDKDNVKALFRRAQARKMLQHYGEGIKDLKHLLDLEPKNGPAKKEMELLKNYWREQLQSMKKDMPTSTKPTSDKGGKSDQGQTKVQPAKTESKPRKRMVIEEVESDEEATPTQSRDSKGKKKEDKAQSQGKSKPKVEEIKLSKTAQPEKTESKQAVNIDKKTTKTSKSAQKKTSIKETSTGLPQVPKSVPKLEKATPYEFISAWNSLKKADTLHPYYELLKQINPGDLKTVISNKLDGNMLTTIVKCVSEHFLKDGSVDTSYQLMQNLSKVPRFGTVSMFMSTQDKSDVNRVMEKLASHKTSLYTPSDIQTLRKAYSV